MNIKLSPIAVAKLLLLVTVIATAAVYWPGLRGPVLFDDYWNLAPVSRWYSGQQSFWSTLLPNQASFIDSRPLSMGSFMLTAWLGGDTTFPLKLGNLIIHLACGLTGWWVLRRALREDPRLAPHAELAAALMAGFWLLHPLHVSTVLYGVQRMAQLSTLFTLAAVGVYLVARRQLIAGRTKTALLNLFGFFPVLMLIGMLGKQNTAVAPFLCLVLEIAYFSGNMQQRRVIGNFYGLFVVLPLLTVAAILVVMPQRVMAGYADLDFTLPQRLLTQPRVLLDYIGMWFLPRGPIMGLYTDDFSISTGFLSPPATLLAFVAMAAISVVALVLRKRAPSIFAGWFFFLAAHGVESTFLPLELYYEHRNYLPSLGLLLAATGVGSLLGDKVRTNVLSLRQLGIVAGTGLILVLAFSTFSRVLVWQTEDAMVEQGLRHHPDSLRLRLDRTALALRKKDYADAVATLTPLLDSKHPRHRLVARIDLVSVNCVRGVKVDPDELSRAVLDAQPMLTVNEVHIALLQEEINRKGFCTNISAKLMADTLVGLLDAATAQPNSAPNKSTIRRLAAQLYARAGLWRTAEHHAQIGWDTSHSMPVGVLLTRAYIKNGKPAQAAALLTVLKGKLRPFDNIWQGELAGLEGVVNERRASPKGDALH